MTTIDVNPQRSSLLQDATTISQLPPELLLSIRDATNNKSHEFLDAIAAAALVPQLTGSIFGHFEPVFPDVCARWLVSPTLHTRWPTAHTNTPRDVVVVASFARILAFAPYLSVFLDRHLQGSHSPPHFSDGTAANAAGSPVPHYLDLESYRNDEDTLRLVLLALWRLNSFDKRNYSRLSRPSQVQSLFRHESPSVRYLAIRIFCQLHDAADIKLEALLERHIQADDSLWADLDGRDADYTFLSLYEFSRVKNIQALRTRAQTGPSAESHLPHLPLQNLTQFVVHYGNTVLPRPAGPVTTSSPLVLTSTTVENLQRLAALLKDGGPILLHGLSGSGKTSLVRELARELGKDDGLVTLHLNEQTDAKVLLGLYATDAKPGSFQWRPGVLTTAVKEGRWVLIEDLDRAPTEVMSTLLPLIERGELLIPSRGERVQAARGFRIFATVRTSLGMNDQEHLPNLIGLRMWNLLATKSLPEGDLGDVINGTYPILHKYTSGILSVYKQLLSTTTGSGRLSLGRGILERPLGTRDLLKWCRRLDLILREAGCKTGAEPVSETTRDRMFMEAVECFAGSIKEASTRKVLISGIAKEMHLSEDRVQHYLDNYTPQLEDHDSRLTVGRVSFAKTRRPNRGTTKSKRPFASTRHAKRLLEQIGVAVKLREPVLLVGETGIGKTTVVQQMADSLGHKLVAVNLSQQSEVGDLLGGFKPVSSRSLAMPLKEEFEDLFEKTGVSADKNKEYLDRINKKLAKGRWTEVSKEWRKAPKMFEAIMAKLESSSSHQTRSEGAADNVKGGDGDDGQQPAKRRKTESSKLQRLLKLKPRWDAFARSLDQFDRQVASGTAAFAFAFVEGNIVKAARNGDWVLLDEINLASPDTLESIADLFQSGPNDTPSILLSETGEIERIFAHPNFRIFGAMNPATDVGKRDLPLGLRSRFTEIYVGSPDRDKKDLLTIIKTYLKGNNSSIDRLADSIADLYLEIKQLTESKAVVDGANEVPHFSLRTLTRVLTYANDVSPLYGLERALYEGFCMGFLTLLSQESEKVIMPRIQGHLLKRVSILSQPPKPPPAADNYVAFTSEAYVSSSEWRKDEQYWLLRGTQAPIPRPDYIVTPYVRRNLLNLVRATSTRRYPILIQGPTSSGKTSMIEYLANASGNKFVRINNHEHTDLQEYLGTYVSGADGELKFQEGLLVQAMRQGSWIVLDELNLAPTDVLEALNRLLDDNRELLIPETQEVVRPNEKFMLFATQNPPGLYGGRKVLSRAFRNRFLELHFDDIPEEELQTILEQRSRDTSPSDCRRIVEVYRQLSRLRQESRVFEQKNSFATLRDLFRWALRRDADTRQDIAENGFMLLAERVRKPEERDAVRQVIETVFKVEVDPDKLYDRTSLPEAVLSSNRQGVVWTRSMRRLYVLVRRAIQNNEPVLLVGETGCGKTTICQLLAEADGKELHIVNAHQNTETGDLIGSQRPVRNRAALLDVLFENLQKASALLLLGQEEQEEDRTTGRTVEQMQERYHSLTASDLARLPASLVSSIRAAESRSKALFEWSDGSLVQAMKTGQLFLLDEISLADDSVLERLNSVLEPHRSLLLAEKGIDDSFVEAADGFQFFATMNPGGDFGKKELSPALRNRFTEIWVPALSEEEDVYEIIVSKLDARFAANNHHDRENAKKNKTKKKEKNPVASVIVEFAAWFGETFRPSSATAFSLRDILAWVQFMNSCPGSTAPEFALLHGAATVFVDTIGANPSALSAVDPGAMEEQRQLCLQKLSELGGFDAVSIYRSEPDVEIGRDQLRIGDFFIARTTGSGDVDTYAGDEFRAPTTKMNAMRVIRALGVNKPVLLEGNPGVGKTTLVNALAKACRRPLTRINLSDQTDLMDLFGTDVPVEGAEAGNFAWKDAPFLQAMQKGEWVLLDEMNLASQSVLEGLNACLDHRGEVYISELDQVFKRHPDFRLFAAQNPHHQGGGRKGLPSSFVNRFIVVYADVFSEQDLLLITASQRFAKVDVETRRHLIDFIFRLDDEAVIKRSFGAQGSPWEFNLRDTLRWLDLLTSSDPLIAAAAAASVEQQQPDNFLDVIIRQRFRTAHDRDEVSRLFATSFRRPAASHSLYHNVDSRFAQVGLGVVQRSVLAQQTAFPRIDPVARLAEIESVLIAAKQNLPCILVGPSGSGKSVLLRHVAALAGKSLVVFPLNADVDTMDLIGGFEQADPHREFLAAMAQLRSELQNYILDCLPEQPLPSAVDLMGLVSSQAEPVAESVLPLLEVLSNEPSLPENLSRCILNTVDLLGKPLFLENPRFEWLDGVIVKAVEAGQWLVLDNANLCSASVLDRLNSLLERPEGFLSINEHSGPGGEPRIIKPHPDFRIFLTVDPRYGELSRAMRNRSVEIYLDGQPAEVEPYLEHITPIEAKLQRFHTAANILDKAAAADTATSHLEAVTFDILSLGDTSLLAKYSQALDRGLGSSVSRSTPVRQWLDQLLSYVHSEDAAGLRKSISTLYQASPGVTLMPLHPLQNHPMVVLLERDDEHAGLAHWLGSVYEFYLDVQTAQGSMSAQLARTNDTKPSMLNRLQRSFISDRIAAASKDSTVDAAKFLASALHLLHEYLAEHLGSAGAWRERRSLLLKLMTYWRQTFHYLCAGFFEEARFQAHLAQGSGLLQACGSRLQEPGSQALVSVFLGRLEETFTVGFKLSTGLSMEVLWHALRPEPIRDVRNLGQVVEMERLANRFDTLRWKANAQISALTSITASMGKVYAIIRSSGRDATDLVKVLQDEISALEQRIGEHSREHRPFFARSFESLRQAIVLHGFLSGRSANDAQQKQEPSIETIVLSNMPTLGQLHLESANVNKAATTTTNNFRAVRYMLENGAAGTTQHPWDGTLSESLLLSLDATASATFEELRSLEGELPIMAKTVARATEALTTDALDKLDNLLLGLVAEVAASHGSELRDQVMEFYQQLLALTDDSSPWANSPDTIPWLDQAVFPSSIQIQVQTSTTVPPPPPHLVEIFQGHFAKALAALAAGKRGARPRRAYSSVAWVQFSLGCIKLYVPDKAFDPYLRAQVERAFHEALRSDLQQRIDALSAFERLFSGQTSNARRDLLVAELDESSSPSLVQTQTMTIYRPPSGGSSGSNELKSLQGEFNNVLNALVHNDVAYVQARYMSMSSLHGSISGDSDQQKGSRSQREMELELVRGNVERLVARFSGRFSAYQDLTAPLVGFLHCMQIGLSLSSTSDNTAEEEENNGSEAFLKITPFLGGKAWESQDADAIPLRSFEFLSFVHVLVAVEGGANYLPDFARHALFESLASFYEEWTKKLEADRRAEEARHSLYRFQGSLEDEEAFDQQEFDELFPDFSPAAADDDEGESAGKSKSRSKKQHTARALSVLLAEAHQKIFLSPREAQATLREFCKQIGRKIAQDSSSHARAVITEGERDKTLLPAALLILEERTKALLSSGSDSNNNNDNDNGARTTYNFYEDPNLPEARKLLALVNEIKARFQFLQTIDEIGHHQTLADVLAVCDAVLTETAADEPLAKPLVLLERLHAFMFEWQDGGWARREHQAPALFDRVRDTICEWRRLELGSWARLFDAEERKCRDDARSWWFVAYGSVVFGPCSRLNNQQRNQGNNKDPVVDLSDYAADLLGTLESYFAGATLGEFAPRLQLLAQLKRQLDLLVPDAAELTVVRDAVANFIRFYRRYEAKVAEAIRAARAPLDRSMKDVLLLFRWNDKNVDALRESARKSHQKLFRLVRKFRAVLARPARAIIEQELPGEEKEDEQHHSLGSITEQEDFPTFNTEAAILSQQMVPGLSANPQWERLSNPEALTRLMRRHGSLPTAAVQAPNVLDSYVSDLLDSMSALRKETPATLTDDNKEEVKHLKTRKAKLFAETLKTVRQMGFSRGLGTGVLERQKSTRLVLASSGLLIEGNKGAGAVVETERIEHYYHRVVDLAPRFRGAVLSHSDELSRDSVGRSVGFLEGVLYVLITQRKELSATSQRLCELENAVSAIKALSAKQQQEQEEKAESDMPTVQKQSANHRQVLRWVVQMLRLAAHLVSIHARFGDLDNGDVHGRLQSRIETFVALQREEQQQEDGEENGNKLPPGFVSRHTNEHHARVEDELDALRLELDDLACARPDLAFVMDQVRLWTRVRKTDITPSSDNNEQTGSSIEAFAAGLTALTSKILVAIQTFQAASQSLPTTTDDSAWLVRYSEGLGKAIDSLRMQKISEELDRTVNSSLLNLLLALKSEEEGEEDDAHTRRAAIATLRAVAPVVEQYALICRLNVARFADLHRATCRLGYHLSKSFVRLAAQGFCTPQEKSNEEGASGESGKLESGTGLGEGEGAEDISKDVQPDEDLSELAQDAGGDDKDAGDKDGDKEMEREKDAVDMGADEMEGELGSVGGDDEEDEDDKGGENDKDGEEEDMDEEAGDVDDLDPTAVDEKMWDGEDEEAAGKDQQGDKGQGQKKEEEQAAAAASDDPSKGGDKEAAAAEENGGKQGEEDGGEEGEEDEGEEEEAGQEQQEEVVHQEELNRQDEHTQQNETMALPEDMDVDIDDHASGSEDDDLDNLSDVDEKQQQEEEHKADSLDGEDDKAKDEPSREQNMPTEEDEEIGGDDANAPEGKEEEQHADPDQDMDMDVDEEGQEAHEDDENTRQPPLPEDKNIADQDKVAPSDVKSGGGQADAEDMDGADDENSAQNTAAQREHGAVGESSADQETAEGEQGSLSRTTEQKGQARNDSNDEETDPRDVQPFKKLGDALERWYRSQRDIRDADPDNGKQGDNDGEQQQNKQGTDNDDMGGAEFQHLHDENAPADTQAMGTATEEEARPIDDAMAIDTETDETQNQVLPEDADEEGDEEQQHGEDKADKPNDEIDKMPDKAQTDRDNTRPGVTTGRGAYDDDDDAMSEAGAETPRSDEEAEDERIEETSSQLLGTHLTANDESDSAAPLHDYASALRTWTTYQTKTHALSISLTSQLRLILTPSQATKLSGSFRTGKRLNIKKIIPYIASSYKRDKIWMRRAVPTRRAYQILLCVDDSSSMGGGSGSSSSAAGDLALESLVMVSRALAMLEAGHVGVLGFGTDVFVAHDLLASSSSSSSSTAAFASSPDAGARALQRFTFAQPSTDVEKLLRRVLDVFRTARLQRAGGGGGGDEDLWQLALVLSDGLVQRSAHARIRPLLRAALEQRVMVVFIVLDDTGNNARGGGEGKEKGGGGGGESVLELKEARFTSDGDVVIERYLDSFPFQYYLIVHRLEDLPGALAGLLRTWFAEVNA